MNDDPEAEQKPAAEPPPAAPPDRLVDPIYSTEGEVRGNHVHIRDRKEGSRDD